MNKSSSVATQKPSSSPSAWANGPPPLQQPSTASPSRSPSATTPAPSTPTHSRKSSILSQAVSVKDGVSVPRGIAPSSSHRNSGLNFGTIEANGSSGPSGAAAATPPLVNGSAGTPPPTKDASAAQPQPKAFGTLPAQASSTTASSTAASSTAAPSPTPSNASTAATSSAAPPKRKLDANKFFMAAPPAQPAATSAAPPPNASTAPPAPPSAVPPSFHPNAPNSSVMAANVAANSPSQRFSTLPPPVNHGAPYYHHHSPQMANQQPVVGGPQTHLRPVQPATGGPRSPSFSSRPPINGAPGVPPPNVTVNGASQGRGPQPAAGQPTGAPTGTVPQVGSPRLGHQPPVMQHQQQQPPGGPVPAPGQMPGQPPYPPSQMQMGWQQPPYGGWQPQYPQYPYMNTEWYPHMQHPHMHQHPHQPPYMQPPGTPHQPFASALPPTQQPPTPANTMSPRTGPMPALPPQASSPAVPHPGAPPINTNLPPSVPSTPVPARPSLTTPLTAGAREFVPGNLGGSSPMIPSPGFPLPKKSNAIKISNPTTGEAVVLRPPDGGHSRTLSRDTAVVHESSPLRKPPIRIENPEDKRAREEKERKAKEEADAKKKKDAEEKLKKEEEEREAKRKAEEAERLKKEEEERLKKEAEEKKRQEEEAEKKRLEDEKRRQEEEEARKKKEEEERIQREAEEKARKEKEEQERKEREERERKEREEAEAAAAAAKAAEEERLRKEAEEAARLAAEAKAKEEAEAKEREEREKLQAPSLSRTASASSVATPLTASPKPGAASLPAKPSLPPISTGSDRPRPARPVPGPLDLSHTQRPPLTPGLPSALASARKIDDLDSVSYPEGIKTPVEMNQGQTKGGKYKYDREFLLQFMQVCKDKPDNLSSLDSLGIERGAGDDNAPSFGSVGRGQRSRMGSMGPPPGNRSASGSIGLGLTGFAGGKGAPFVMGNFASTPSRMTSEERFAASNNRDRAVSGSGFIRGGAVPMGRSSSQGGVGGIGGPNAVPPSPREQGNRTRSQRGRTRNDSLKPNAPQPSHQQQQQQAALSGLEPVVPLQATENRWTPAARSRLAVDENSPEFVEKKVKGLLNKLTLENFDSVSTQIISWANKSENEKNGATLILVIKLVFEKATDEAHWSEMYARLCRKMMEQISQNVQDDNIRNSSGEPIVGGNLFRKYLLNRCQEDFERGWSQKESAQAAAALKAADDKRAEDASKASGEDGEPVLYSDEYYALLKAKRQGLGLVRFIGELFKLQMLTERIMHECIKKLLSKIENPEEEEIESLCKLLTTVGQALDTPKAKGHMDIYFGRMQMLADNPNVASRIRYMLLDVIELRLRNWRPRNATAGPSTIAQVREQDAKEKAAAAQQASKIVPMTRGGSQRGGRGQPEQGPDGWNVAGPTPVRAPAKAGDLSNFGKFTASTGPLKTMGPSSAFKKGDRGRDTPPPGSSGSLSRAASGGNMYSLLGAGGADADTMPKRTPSGRGTTRKPSVDQAPQQAPDTPLRRKLNLLPRTVSSANTNEDSAGDEDKPESDEEQAGAPTKSLTEQEAKAKVEEDVKEFFNIRDVSEGEKSFAELPDEHKSKLVDKLAGKALELKESDVKLVAELFDRAAGKGCPPSAFEDGLAGIIEFLDDMVIDVPQAYAFMARLLRGARLPQETVESLGDKIFVDGDPVVKPKDKLLKAYNALA